MKWEDTVLDFPERRNAINEVPITGRRRSMRDTAQGLCEAQAEVSFKAGRKEEMREWVKACMQSGMLISEPQQLVDTYKAAKA